MGADFFSDGSRIALDVRRSCVLLEAKVREDLDDELRSYVELMAAEKVQRGMSHEDAFRQAWSELGGIEQVKESVRDVRPWVLIDTLLQDIRYAVRTLRRNRAFAFIALLTLALGIGANTTIFTVVDAVLLKPLPYPEPNRLLTLWERSRSDGEQSTVAPANFYDWHEQSPSFSRMAAIDPYPDFILGGSTNHAAARRLSGADVSADFFSLLGTRMELGRDFLAEEDRPGHNQGPPWPQAISKQWAYPCTTDAALSSRITKTVRW